MSRRAVDVLVITAIWVLVSAAAVVLLAVWADDDSATGEASGAGALIAIGGGLFTALYLAMRRIPSREQRIDIVGTLVLFVVGTGVAIAVGIVEASFFVGGTIAAVFLLVRRGRRKST